MRVGRIALEAINRASLSGSEGEPFLGGILQIDEELLTAAARELFAAVKAKKVRVLIGQKYPLAQAAEAQRDLEGRRTTGSTVLLP